MRAKYVNINEEYLGVIKDKYFGIGKKFSGFEEKAT